MTYPKTTCACIGCKRWSRKVPPDWSFLCRDHWMMVPKKLRVLHGKAIRKANRQPSAYNRYREGRIWNKCVAAAIREAVGIGQ